jgi:CHAT domain-containing protein/Tfp pilus assembly protein PilF
LTIGAVLTAPSGDLAARAGRSVRRTVKLLSLVTRQAGRYRLTLTASASPGPPGGMEVGYEVVIEDLRPATAKDPFRVKALRQLAEGLSLGQTALPEAGPEAQERLEEARRWFHQAGDFDGETDARIEIQRIAIDGQDPVSAAAAEPALRAIQAASERRGYWRGAAAALNNLASAEIVSGQYEKAFDSSLRALALWHRLGDLPAAGETASDLGYICRSWGPPHYEEGQRWAEKAIAIQQATGDVAGQAHALNSLATLLNVQWNLPAAEEAYQRALAKSVQLGDHPQEIALTSSLATVYHRRGELQKALDLYVDALGRGEAADWQGRNYANLGSLYVELGNFEEARLSYARALSLLPPDGTYRINALINSGSLLLAENPGAALELYQRALHLARSGGAKLEVERGHALHALGKAYLRLQKLDEALRYFNQELAIWKPGEQQEEIAKALLERGDTYRLRADFQPAAADLDQALALARQTHRPAIVAACLLQQALLDRDRGRFEPARRKIEEVLDDLEKARSRFLRDQTRVSFFSTAGDYYQVEVDLLVREGRWADALTASERARARGLLDLLSEGRLDLNQGISQDLKAQEAKLEKDLYGSQSHLADAARRRDQATIDQLQQDLLDIERREEDLAQKIRSQNPRYSAVRYPKPLDAAAISSRLDGQTAFLEYFLGSERSFLFVATRQGITGYPLPPRGEIEARVRRLGEAISHPPSLLERGKLRGEAAELYRILLAPAASLLAGRPHLLIAPDGSLDLLPFEVLLTDPSAVDGNRPASTLPFLLLRHTITYVPSASVLAEIRALGPPGAPDPASRFVAFADPLTRPAGGNGQALPSLPGSEDEVAAIARLYPAAAVKLYLRERATKANVLRSVGSAERIHFATHGVFFAGLPELSGLVLSAEREGDEAILRVNDIFNLKLRADLVVLSACDTGLGREVSGEGLVGLSRAFFYAGTRSLVVSLWKAADVSTSRLMPDFYRRLSSVGKGEALRQAKLARIGEGRFSEPYYWAPFVLVGDPK